MQCHQGRSSFRIQYSSIALLYYDYALTFPSEVKYMWNQKFRFSTTLYILCRYAMIANIVYVLAVTGKFHSSCDAWYKFDGALSVLGRAAVIATLTARTYAVFGCSQTVLALLTALSIACLVLDIMHVPGLKCVGSSDDHLFVKKRIVSGVRKLKLTTALAYLASLLLAILMRVFELVAALLTTIRSLMEFRIGGTWTLERGSFYIVVFNQGVIYIIFTTVISIAAALLQYRAPPGTLFQRLLNALSLPLSCLLTARFLLQLREWQQRGFVFPTGQYDIHCTIDTQHQVQTLSAFRAMEGFDAAVMDDFGDDDAGHISTLHSDWGQPRTPQMDAREADTEMQNR